MEEAKYVEIDICEELLVKTTLDPRIKRLSKIWWENYHLNSLRAESDLTNFLLRTGGLKNLPITGEINDFLENKLLTSRIDACSDVLIFKKHFCENFKKFLIYLLKYNNWYFFSQTELIQHVLRVICGLKLSGYNSVRNVSYITGMKIMKEIYICQLQNIQDRNSYRAVTLRISEVENFIYKEIIRRSLRDLDIDLRLITVTELNSWFYDFETKDLALILCPFLKHIERNLFDERRVKMVALDILIKIYSTTDFFTDVYISLFNSMKPYLFGLIVMKDYILSFKSIQLVNNAVRNFSYSLSNKEKGIVFSCLFNKKTSLAIQAKALICSDFCMNNLLHEELLLNVLVLCKSFPVKNSELVIHFLVDFLISRVNWDDWFSVITNSQLNVKKEALSLFYEFCKYIVNFEAPESDESNCDTLFLKRTFTENISCKWMILVNDDIIKLDSKLLIYLIKIFLLFDITSLSNELIKNVMDYSLQVFLTEEDHFLLKECIQVLDKCPEDYTLDFKFPDLSSVLIQTIRDNNEHQQLLDLASYRIILLLKNFICDTDSLWSELYLSFNNCSSSKVQKVVLLLFHIILNDKSNCINQICDNKSESLHISVKWLKLRVKTFVYTLMKCTSTNSSPVLHAKVLQLFSQVINNFGNHLAHHQVLHCFNFGTIIEDHVLTYVERCSVIMEQKCCELRNECCLAVKNCVFLIANLKLNVSYFQYFFHYFGPENRNHSLLIVYAIDMCLKEKPNLAKEIIKSALNGFIEHIILKPNFIDDHYELILINKLKFLLTNSTFLGRERCLVLLYLEIKNVMNKGSLCLLEVKNFIETLLNSEILKKVEIYLHPPQSG